MLEALLVTLNVKYVRHYLKVFQESLSTRGPGKAGSGTQTPGPVSFSGALKKESAYSRAAPERRSLESADPGRSW
jgi:hypothetical protein